MYAKHNTTTIRINKNKLVVRVSSASAQPLSEIAGWEAATNVNANLAWAPHGVPHQLAAAARGVSCGSSRRCPMESCLGAKSRRRPKDSLRDSLRDLKLAVGSDAALRIWQRQRPTNSRKATRLKLR